MTTTSHPAGEALNTTSRLQESRAVDDVTRLMVLSALKQRLFKGAKTRELGRYELRQRLGEGGFGVVLEAWDPELERAVAIKLVRTDRCNRDQMGIELLEEARLAARLSHANVVAVHDVGRYQTEDGSLGVFLVMEMVRGQTLSAWLRERPRPRAEILDAFIQAGRGLAAAHAIGMVHRDFKPANALIDESGRVRVADFGLAAIAPRAPSPTLRSGETTTLSGETPVAGTPRYMAPEQLLGDIAGPACDQYSLCLALREALSGHPPFDGTRTQMGLAKHEPPPPWPRHDRTPRALRRVIDRGLDPHPGCRWPSLDALLDALSRAARPRRRWTQGAVLGSLVAITAGYASSAPPPCPTGQAQMDALWDAEQQDSVREALLKIPADHADATWRTVRSRLDDHTRRWMGEYQASCEATRIAAEPSAMPGATARLECLERNRSQLAQTVAVLASADRETLDQAAMLVVGLDGPERCARTRSADEAEGSATDRTTIQGQLARAEVLIAAGRFEAARALIDVARVTAHEHVPALESDVMLVEGALLSRQAHFDRAESTLREALDAALEHGRDSTAILAGAELAYTLGVSQARLEDAQTVAVIADAMARRRDAEGLERATALYNYAIVLRHMGRLEPSEAAHRSALVIRQRTLPPDHPEVLQSLQGLAATLASREHTDEALELTRRVVRIRRQVQGGEHHGVGDAEINEGHLLFEMGEYAEAHRVLEHAVSVLERALGPDHPSVVLADQNLASTEVRMGEMEAASRRLERALATSRRALGPDHPSTLGVQGNLAYVHIQREQWDLAERELQQVLAFQRDRLEATDPRLVPTMANLASTLAHRGALDRALDLWREAIDIRAQMQMPHALPVIKLRLAAAEALLDAQRADEAAPHLAAIGAATTIDDRSVRDRVEAARARL